MVNRASYIFCDTDIVYMKILNLYAGLGGNRKFWGDEHEITAVEYKPNVAKFYQDQFPKDKIVIADAHDYLLKHFMEFDFIWSSPPCPTHSQIRFIATYSKEGKIRQKPVYPDMKLYEEILLLKHYFKGKWCVENVVGFYEPLIRPQKIGSHYFWMNFVCLPMNTESRDHYGTIESLEKRKGFDLKDYKGINKRLALRNCVEPEIGKQILNFAINPIYEELQSSLL